MKKLDVRLLRMMGQAKGQFLSITVIIAVALCIFMLFKMLSINIRDGVKEYYKLTNMNDIQVQLVKIPQSALADIQAIDGVKDVQGRISVDVPLNLPEAGDNANIRIISVPDEELVNKLYLLRGQKTSLEYDKMYLLEQFAKARSIQVGDEITPYIGGRTYNLKVAAIVASPEFVYLMENEQSLLPAAEKFGVAYVSEDFAHAALGYDNSYNEVLVTVKEGADVDDIVDKLDEQLDKYGVKRIVKLENQLSNNVLTQKMDGIDQMSDLLPVLFLLVAAIVIVVMLSRIVSNDRMAIGVMKASGYGNIAVLSHYIKYALAIGLAGSVLGIGGGIWLSRPMTRYFVTYFNLPITTMSVYYNDVYKGILLTVLFCVASGFLGAKSVLGVMPAEAMHPSTPKAGRKIMLERFGSIWTHLSFSWKMAVRNIMRTKRRVAFLILGLSLGFAINTVPLYEGNALPLMFKVQYGQFMKMDYTVDFTTPLEKNVVTDISNLVSARRIEPKIEYAFELENGWRKKTVGIIGAPQDTAFYEFRKPDNSLVTLQPGEIFITEAMAKSLNVGEGDYLTIKNFLPDRDKVVLRVGAVVQQYLGGNAYMEINTMADKLLTSGMITGVSLSSDDDVTGKLQNIKNISSIRSINDMREAFLEFMDTMILVTRLYILLGGLLSFAIIYNSTIISLSERSMELASLRIMGFHKRDIYFMILKENVLMTLGGIILGIPLGIGMINAVADAYSSDIMTLPKIMPPVIFLTVALATVAFMAVAQLAAKKKIYNLNFIDALKSRIS